MCVGKLLGMYTQRGPSSREKLQCIRIEWQDKAEQILHDEGTGTMVSDGTRDWMGESYVNQASYVTQGRMLPPNFTT